MTERKARSVHITVPDGAAHLTTVEVDGEMLPVVGFTLRVMGDGTKTLDLALDSGFSLEMTSTFDQVRVS
ncbi:MAG TPA: hypothetical protein VFH54_06020 [Mycobacteriales bacterium]|nr:hypothetical protein [Mycobacteriales bacterium]